MSLEEFGPRFIGAFFIGNGFDGLRVLKRIGANKLKINIMTQKEEQFWSINEDTYKQIVETDSYIYRFYINSIKANIGVFYDKLMDRWDTACVKNGKINTLNLKINKAIHQLSIGF